MTIDEILRERNRVSEKDMLPLTNIQTAEDIEKYRAQGYLVAYTCDEWAKIHPTLDVKKSGFCLA